MGAPEEDVKNTATTKGGTNGQTWRKLDGIAIVNFLLAC